MPAMSSLAALRLRPFRLAPPIHYPSLASSLLRCSPSRFAAAAALSSHENSRKSSAPDKYLLRARDAVSSVPAARPLPPSLDPAEHLPRLLPSQAVGLVFSAQANFMRVAVQAAGGPPDRTDLFGHDPRIGRELLCVVRSVLKKIGRRVLVGDRVLVIAVDWAEGRGMIEDVFRRNTEVADPPVANVDHLLVLFSLDQPKPEPFTLTRFLVEAESTGIPVTLALNKAELVDKETLSSWKERLLGWGYQPVFCSVNQQTGLDALQVILKGQKNVIFGPSGVGKSSLINSLRSTNEVSDYEDMDNLLERYERNTWLGEQRVGTVSKSGRGKHTTRHVSLLPLIGGGYLADTPGFNQPSLLKVAKKSLAETFPEIRQMLETSGKCAFNNCLHVGEPGCSVKGDWERYPYYLQLLDEIKIREEFQLRTLGTKREGDVRYKVGDMGVKQAEPRLQPKKHRRVSRKRVNQSILDDLDEIDELEDYWSDTEERS